MPAEGRGTLTGQQFNRIVLICSVADTTGIKKLTFKGKCNLCKADMSTK